MSKKESMGGKYGANLVKSLGTTSQGISKFSKEPSESSLTPLSNRFSAQHDIKMSEAIKIAKPVYMTEKE